MTGPTEFYIGQDVTVTMTVTNPDGSPGEPSDVRFKLKPPTGVVVEKGLGDPGVSTVEVGLKYSITFDMAQVGGYKLRAEAIKNGEVVGVSEIVIYSLASLVE